MGKLNFTRVECIESLKKLGFILKTTRAGIHDKYYAPQSLQKPGRRPFVMVPRHRVIHCQGAILQEIRAIGGKELEARFLENL